MCVPSVPEVCCDFLLDKEVFSFPQGTDAANNAQLQPLQYLLSEEKLVS